MQEIKLPLKGIIGALFAGMGVGIMLTLSPEIIKAIGIPLAVVGVILLIWDIKEYKTRKKLLSLPEIIDTSKEVWGLWHTGKSIIDAHRMESGTSIKKVLLFDYQNSVELAKLVERGEYHGYESDVVALIKKLTVQALMLRDTGVEVRWYQKPMSYSLVICERQISGMNIVEDFSSKAYINIQFYLAKVNKDKRPKYLLLNKGKQDEKESFKFYAREFLDIWDNHSRPINSIADMERKYDWGNKCYL
jgi:hypothetical protein